MKLDAANTQFSVNSYPSYFPSFLGLTHSCRIDLNVSNGTTGNAKYSAVETRLFSCFMCCQIAEFYG